MFYDGTRQKVNETKGQWNDIEHGMHINQKELLAVFFSLKSLFENCANITIKICSDSSTRGAHREKFTFARLASNFKITLASVILHSPVRYIM